MRNTVKTDFLTVTEKLKLSQSEIRDIRVEAIKEFAERLKHTIHQSVYQYWNTPDGGYYLAEDVDDDIDSLVEEMTERKDDGE